MSDMVRNGVLVMVLAGAAGGPWIADQVSSSTASPDATATTDTAIVEQIEQTLQQANEPVVVYGDARIPDRIEGPPVADFSELFRFDVTVGWIHNRWGRVSHAPRKNAWQGYRVAAVSGTALDDIAGSLTYYFDRDHRVAAIEFIGTTGDPLRLISSMSYSYGLRPQMAQSGGVHLYERTDTQLSARLIVRPSAEFSSDYADRRYQIELELIRPDAPIARPLAVPTLRYR
jgi:hypothetical protein